MNCVATVRAGGNASNVEAKKTKRFLCGLQDPCKCLFATWWPWKCMGNNRRGWKSNNTVHLSQAQDDPSSGKAHESIIINEFSSNTLRGLKTSFRHESLKVALQWGLSKGSSMIVKSFNQKRLKENMEALNVKLDDQDLTDIEKLEEWKIMRGEFLVNDSTSPYKTIEDLWDGEIWHATPPCFRSTTLVAAIIIYASMPRQARPFRSYCSR